MKVDPTRDHELRKLIKEHPLPWDINITDDSLSPDGRWSVVDANSWEVNLTTIGIEPIWTPGIDPYLDETPLGPLTEVVDYVNDDLEV